MMGTWRGQSFQHCHVISIHPLHWKCSSTHPPEKRSSGQDVKVNSDDGWFFNQHFYCDIFAVIIETIHACIHAFSQSSSQSSIHSFVRSFVHSSIHPLQSDCIWWMLPSTNPNREKDNKRMKFQRDCVIYPRDTIYKYTWRNMCMYITMYLSLNLYIKSIGSYPSIRPSIL